jgi:predicted nuclease of predicted toxin-antitoxin system
MTFILDENLPHGWSEYLRSAGLDAVPWSVLGPPDAPDSAIIAYAVQNRCVILSRDLDFGIYLTKTQAIVPSVIQLRTNDTNPNLVGDQVIEAIRDNLPELLSGALITIDAWTKRRTRVARLPISTRL